MFIFNLCYSLFNLFTGVLLTMSFLKLYKIVSDHTRSNLDRNNANIRASIFKFLFILNSKNKRNCVFFWRWFNIEIRIIKKKRIKYKFDYIFQLNIITLLLKFWWNIILLQFFQKQNSYIYTMVSHFIMYSSKSLRKCVYKRTYVK